MFVFFPDNSVHNSIHAIRSDLTAASGKQWPEMNNLTT